MKTLLTSLAVALAFGSVSEAGLKSCLKPEQNNCAPCKTTRWYKAKDGTYREMMPYKDALSRAEDADDMEPVLKQAQADLVAANAAIEAAKAEIEAAKAEAANVKAALEAQVAELNKQLEGEKKTVATEKSRAEKAEAAHKMCIEEVAQLRDAGKKQDEALASTKGELKTTTEERDALKTAKTDLEKQVTDLTAAKNAAEEALKAAQAEMEKMKQEAAESKKAAVEGEPAKEGEDPNAGGEKPPEAGTEPAPATEPTPEPGK